jgi:WD40 repeat protein
MIIEDLSVGLWNLADPANPTVRFLHGHDARPISVTFTSDGGSLASVGQDQTLRLWNAMTGELKQTLRAERPYEGVRVHRLRGLTVAEGRALRGLGALDD